MRLDSGMEGCDWLCLVVEYYKWEGYKDTEFASEVSLRDVVYFRCLSERCVSVHNCVYICVFFVRVSECLLEFGVQNITL